MSTVKLQKDTPQIGGSGGGIKLNRHGDKPVFDSLFGDPPAAPLANPLDTLAYPGDVEGNTLAEAQAVREAFQQKYRGELEQFRAQDDLDYWFLVCFQTREQKDRFLEAVGWVPFGGHRYLDGLQLAAKLGVPIEPIPLRRQTVKPAAKILLGEVTDEA